MMCFGGTGEVSATHCIWSPLHLPPTPLNHIIDGDIWSDSVCVSLEKTDLTDDAFDAALVGHVMDERERLEWAPYQNAFDHDLLLERRRGV